MKTQFLRAFNSQSFALLLALAVFAAPLRAQQPAVPAQNESQNDPTFDTLLATDSYKLYGEVRNVGQLLTTGGAGEIVEPILKLASPGPEFNSIVEYLKKNSEALASSRLMFASWPTRTDLPNAFVAIEFATPAEAAKFSPTLETFLPKVLPPVPVEPAATPESSPLPEPSPQGDSPDTNTPTADEMKPKPAKERTPSQETPPAGPTASPEMRLPFVITRTGSLVFISDKTFKFEKLRPKSAALLAEDHNFRVARDRFASEPVFLFFNIALEEKTRPKPPPRPVISEEEQQRIQQEEEAEIQRMLEEERIAREKAGEAPKVATVEEMPGTPQLVATVESPTPTPTKEQQAQTIASNQLGNMLNMLGQGQPQWPEAIGLALALDNDEYVLRAILIDAPGSKRLTLPMIPQLISGPTQTAEAASVLPDDTEVMVSASVDFAKTYEEMKKQAELSAKNTRFQASAGATDSLDSFAAFEKNAGLKISDDLLPVLGNELAVAASLKAANIVNIFGVPTPPSKPSTDPNDKEKAAEPFPIILIAIRDREAAKRLMPRVLDGLGFGAANLIAQTERREDSEIVNYAGVFSYAFVGNFLVISDSATIRRVADANANRQTLSSNNAFRNARHWQPRQTMGEIYVSPALMEGYQDQVAKQAGMLDQTMRDFLMRLSPKPTAITYALSHDGLGAQHELHLPKNLILAMVASTSATMSAMKQGSPEMNEMIAIGGMQMLFHSEETYKTTAGNGSYGSIDELVEKKLVTKEMFEKYGYKYDLTTSGQSFTAVATPMEYGKTGKRSFFIDQTGVVRGDDHGGGPATSADKPVQ